MRPVKWSPSAGRNGCWRCDYNCRFPGAGEQQTSIDRKLARGRSISSPPIRSRIVPFPPPSEAVYAAENEQMERDLRLFLSLEIARTGAVPVAIELPFGFEQTEPEEPLSRAEAVGMDIGSGKDPLAGANRPNRPARGRQLRSDRLQDGRPLGSVRWNVCWRAPAATRALRRCRAPAPPVGAGEAASKVERLLLLH